MMTLRALDGIQLKALDATASTIGLSTELLMERSGYELARFIAQKTTRTQHVLFVCGPGNNGGDGLAACRHLHNLGYSTSALIILPLRSSQAVANSKILDRLSIPLHDWEQGFSFSPYDIIIDCMLGYSQTRAPDEAIAKIIAAINHSGKHIIACDLPTGMHVDEGAVYEHCIRAQETLTLAAPKRCFSSADAKQRCGQIIVAGIGIPALAYEQLGLTTGEYLVEGQTELE